MKKITCWKNSLLVFVMINVHKNCTESQKAEGSEIRQWLLYHQYFVYLFNNYDSQYVIFLYCLGITVFLKCKTDQQDNGFSFYVYLLSAYTNPKQKTRMKIEIFWLWFFQVNHKCFIMSTREKWSTNSNLHKTCILYKESLLDIFKQKYFAKENKDHWLCKILFSYIFIIHIINFFFFAISF